jgi:hypothetical protein
LLKSSDAAIMLEVIEHIDPNRLRAMERAVFGYARPAHVTFNTPNVEYNARLTGLARQLRHRDHRFEWSRPEFRHWATSTGKSYRYSVEFDGVGLGDRQLGPPAQLALFSRTSGNDSK